MKNTTRGGLCFLLLCGAIPMILSGCGSTQKPEPAPAALTAEEQQAVDNLKNMSLDQQHEFLKNNPKLAANPGVQAQMQASAMKKK